MLKVRQMQARADRGLTDPLSSDAATSQDQLKCSDTEDKELYSPGNPVPDPETVEGASDLVVSPPEALGSTSCMAPCCRAGNRQFHRKLNFMHGSALQSRE